MRRTAVLALAAVALSTTAGVAQAASGDTVTDVIAVPSAAGVLSMTGAGFAGGGAALGSVSAPVGSSSSATIGGAAAVVPGALLTVLDATGSNAGWHVTAAYAALDTSALNSVKTALGAANVADLGGANISVAPSTATTGTTNAVTGVPTSGLDIASGSPLGSGAVTLVGTRSGQTGIGTTAFTTTYSIALPTKSLASTVYTGSVVYTIQSGL